MVTCKREILVHELQGTIGGFAPTAGYEVGFNLPLGDTFFVTVGYADGGGEAVLQ